MEKIQNGIEGDLRENRQVGEEPTEKDLRLVVASPLSDYSYKVPKTGLEPAPPLQGLGPEHCAVFCHKSNCDNVLHCCTRG